MLESKLSRDYGARRDASTRRWSGRDTPYCSRVSILPADGPAVEARDFDDHLAIERRAGRPRVPLDAVGRQEDREVVADDLPHAVPQRRRPPVEFGEMHGVRARSRHDLRPIELLR